jgi:prolipoprotein diacylglyceryl transferase
MTPLFLPAPPFRDIMLGPLTIHMYSLTMITAILLAWWWTGKRIESRGGDRDDWDTMALFAVIFGIIGARAYHVITEHARYFGPGLDPWNALKIWNGGLGVIGSIIGGGLAVLVYCHLKHIRFSAIADAIAPTLLAAQAWGRVGNWFNQEAFGEPSTLPWALRVDPAYRPVGYAQYATFHPTFLYEGVWNLIGMALLLLVLQRRLHLGWGKLFVSYVLWYSFGRFFIEMIRIDPVDKVDGVRINDWTDGAVFLGAVIVMVLLIKLHPGPDEHPFAPVGAGPDDNMAADAGTVVDAGTATDDDVADAVAVAPGVDEPSSDGIGALEPHAQP